ncbi:MAG: ribosomal protein S18-alanine N-acetyltransferase [Dehalococcoidia bacterium]|jgi:ribosomal-protein-alanine acetyltransferase|nr:ribosomal-protein-alanine N-acetyltransferase [Chloroflexota bacterium]MDP6425583.1 ribosomal protein S18-alanine N-acetyltransferase [Dehalococcoidia bacterium]MDP7231578.1 ribosomal protein S18-alanine N-acetyltransferase [Dehalococcoidia bacterium]MDP7612375.1 ribosomal protein S18-alanine N-acetyltransferase [Dehalococcoidia bacterium]
MRKQKNLRYFLRYARKGDVKIIDSINLSASIQKNFVQSVKELEDSSSVIIVVTRNWSRTEKIKNPRELINQAYQKDQNNNRSLVPKFIIKVFDFIIRTKPPIDYVIGFISLRQVIEEVHVMMLAIKPDERRNGLGELLLIGALQEAIKRKARTVTLEVQSSNLSAQALYKKYGFIEVGVRKNYYSKNENALILTTPNINLDNFKDILFKSFEAYKFRFKRKTVELVYPPLTPLNK